MNVKIFLIAVLIVFFGFFFVQKGWMFKSSGELQKEQSITDVNTDSENKENGYTFESQGIDPNKEKAFKSGTTATYTSKSGAEVSFAGTIIEARNPGSHILLNKKEIATVEGHGIVDASFSEDNKRFAFSVMSICGASCVKKYNYEIDLTSEDLSFIK